MAWTTTTMIAKKMWIWMSDDAIRSQLYLWLLETHNIAARHTIRFVSFLNFVRGISIAKMCQLMPISLHRPAFLLRFVSLLIRGRRRLCVRHP